MNDSIVARETLQLLLDYPIREYPPPEPLDKNGKTDQVKGGPEEEKEKKKEGATLPDASLG